MSKISLWQCEESKVEHGNFSFLRKRLGMAAGGRKLGVSWFEIQPGKKAFPFHFHRANEEGLFVLEGEPGPRSWGHNLTSVHRGDSQHLPGLCAGFASPSSPNSPG